METLLYGGRKAPNKSLPRTNATGSTEIRLQQLSRTFAVALACATLALTLADCGKKSPEMPQASALASASRSVAGKAAPSAAIDPCSLLGKTDARAILGEPVTDGRVDKEVGFAPGRRCSYFTSAPIEQRGGTYEVYVEAYDMPTFEKEGSYFKTPADYYHRNHDTQMSTSPDKPADVSAVGDSAFWQPTGGILHVLDRGVYLMLSVHADFHIPPGPGDKVEAEETAAELRAATKMAKTVVLPRLESLD